MLIHEIIHRLIHSSINSSINSLNHCSFDIVMLDSTRSMSLTLADLKTLEEKSDIEEAVAELEKVHKSCQHFNMNKR